MGIKYFLARLGIHSIDVQPSPVIGLKTVLTDRDIFYISNNGRHIIYKPLYDLGKITP
ncbi:disulfide isomerase DsbC N-terminal domain-containing protein [Candidatus Steffania adelgidicola]|uniref:disulfide isomerase DsbC N-terminal domain-containing protein n=1 Tax=Candidatus Steffania adelgidicola TaxID=1076626 RepID=UPI001D031746|nr:disulfide isomerase DsbC N-terminal domain-containing protein [Candidatus Steffania adelgidicola]